MPRLRAERARLPPPVTRRCPCTGAMEDEERLKKLEAGKAKVGGCCGGAGTGTRGGDGGCGGGPGSARPGSARLGSAGTRGEQSLGGGVRFVLPRVPLPLSLPPAGPARGRGRPRRGERHRWRRSPAPRRLAPEPFKPRRLPVRLPGGLQSRQLRLSVLLMPLRKGGLRAPRAV